MFDLTSYATLTTPDADKVCKAGKVESKQRVAKAALMNPSFQCFCSKYLLPSAVLSMLKY
jgi:hypothetical protein